MGLIVRNFNFILKCNRLGYEYLLILVIIIFIFTSSYQTDLYTYIINSNHKYTQSYCYKLCIQKYIIQVCGCYYLKYPMVISSSACSNYTQLECINEAIYAYIDISKDQCENDCPLECENVKHDFTLSSLSYPSSQMFNLYGSKFNYPANQTLASFKQDSLSFIVYYPNLVYTQLTESPKFSYFDLLAQIGGSLGIFLSFSIFTFVEIGELICLTLFEIIFNKLHKRK